MLGKGDRRIWTRYTDLEPSAGKITQILRAAESIRETSIQGRSAGRQCHRLSIFSSSRYAKDWKMENENQMEMTI